MYYTSIWVPGCVDRFMWFSFIYLFFFCLIKTVSWWHMTYIFHFKIKFTFPLLLWLCKMKLNWIQYIAGEEFVMFFESASSLLILYYFSHAIKLIYMLRRLIHNEVKQQIFYLDSYEVPGSCLFGIRKKRPFICPSFCLSFRLSKKWFNWRCHSVFFNFFLEWWLQVIKNPSNLLYLDRHFKTSWLYHLHSEVVGNMALGEG